MTGASSPTSAIVGPPGAAAPASAGGARTRGTATTAEATATTSRVSRTARTHLQRRPEGLAKTGTVVVVPAGVWRRRLMVFGSSGGSRAGVRQRGAATGGVDGRAGAPGWPQDAPG